MWYRTSLLSKWLNRSYFYFERTNPNEKFETKNDMNRKIINKVNKNRMSKI